jgi:hypothetical protein
MTDFLWPTSLVPARSEVKLLDLATRFRSPFTGTSRTYARPGGDVLSMSMQMPPLKDAKRAALTAFLASLRGGVHRVWCQDHSYVRRGSFPAVELLANNTFASGTTGWTGGSKFTRTVADRVLRITCVDASAAESVAYPTAALTFVSGATYALRSATYSARGALQRRMRSDSTPGGGSWGSGTYSAADGASTLLVTAGGTSGYISVAASNTGAFVDDAFDLPWISVARCALVKGASQTGTKLIIDQLPASTNGLLLAGDRVQIGEELLTVIAPLDSNSSGEGTLILHRPLRSAPADNAPVIIHEPMGLFMLAEQENGWLNDPGRVSSATVNLIEAIR